MGPLIRTTLFVAVFLPAVSQAGTPSAGPHGIVQPPGGFRPRGTLDAYVSIRQPQRPLFMWISGSSKSVRFDNGRSWYDAAWVPYALSFGVNSGYAVHQADYERSPDLRIHVTDDPTLVYWKSVEFQSYGSPGVGGVYYAAKAGVPDVWVCCYAKHTLFWNGDRIDTSRARRVSDVNAIRFMGYAALLRWGWPPQRSVPAVWMGNPDLGGPIRYPADNWPGLWTLGRGGWGKGEAEWLVSGAGPPWIAYWESSLTPGARAIVAPRAAALAIDFDPRANEPFPPPPGK